MLTLDEIKALLHGTNAKALMEQTNPSSDVSVSDNTVTQNGAIQAPPTDLDTPPPSSDTNADASSATPVPASVPTPTPETSPSHGVSGSWDKSPVPMTPAPTAVSSSVPIPKTTPSVPESNNLDNTITAPSTNDNAARTAMLEEQDKQRKLGIIPNILGGLADTVGNAAKPFGGQGASGTQDEVIKQQQNQTELNKINFETKLQNDPNSDISKSYRAMVLEIAPDLAKNADFQNMSAKAIGDKLPLIDTVMKAKASEDAKKIGLAQAQSNRELNIGLRTDQQQDRLEGQAIQRVAALRGDQSLARIENQRDGAIQANATLQQAKDEKRPLSQAEYYDILFQLLKARTGTATEQGVRDLDSKTFGGDLRKAATYFTGKPMGNTTPEVLDNLQHFVQSTGHLIDQQHDAYMAPHLIKPAGLNDDRWQPIANTARGMSFAQSLKQTQKSTTATSTKDPLGIL